jgi:hypothetical protein
MTNLDEIDVAVIRETLQQTYERGDDVMATFAPRYGTQMTAEFAEWRQHNDSFTDLLMGAVESGVDLGPMLRPLAKRIPQETRESWAKFPARSAIRTPRHIDTSGGPSQYGD